MKGISTFERTYASPGSQGIRPIVAVLDIGAAKTTVVAGKLNDSGRLEILGFGESEGPFMQHGMLLNVDESVASVRRALKDCLASNPSMRIEEVFVGVSGSHTMCLQTHCDVMRRDIDVEIRQDELDGLVSDQYKTPLAGDSRVIEVVPRCFYVDSLKNIPNPAGCFGSKIGADFHVVTGERGPLHLLSRCVERAGLKVASWMMKPLASACAVVSEDDLEAGVAVLDIGGGTTGLSVFYNGGLQHVSVIPFGGENVTSDIKRGLGLLRRDAEQMKRLHGCAIEDNPTCNDYLSLVRPGGLSNREFGTDALSRIIQARMSEVLEFVNHNLAKAGIDRRMLNGGIVLTGGGSKLKKMVPLTEYVTGLDARIGHPDLHLEAGHPEKLADPAYSTCLGLLLRGVGKNHGLPMPRKIGHEGGFRDKALFSDAPEASVSPRKPIKILGVGGVGINALSRMLGRSIDGVGLAISDTEELALAVSEVAVTSRICHGQPGGLGSGFHVDMGFLAQEGSERGFRDFLRDETGMLLIMAGMGGGRGTPSAPMLARIAREVGVPTVGIVATPFLYEGKGMARCAQEGIEEMRRQVDALLVIDNRTLGRMNGDLTLKEVSKASESAMASSAKCIINALQMYGRMDPDYKASCVRFTSSGIAFLGSASSTGHDRARTALRRALENPLSEGVVLKCAEWVWVHVESPEGENECRIGELDLIQSLILDITGSDTDVIVGLSPNNGPAGSMSITVLAPACGPDGAQTVQERAGGSTMEDVFTNSPDGGNTGGIQYQRSFKRLMTQDPGFVPREVFAEVSPANHPQPGNASISADEIHPKNAFTQPLPSHFEMGDENPSDVACRDSDLPTPSHSEESCPNQCIGLVIGGGDPEAGSVESSSRDVTDPTDATSKPEVAVSRKPEDAEIWFRMCEPSPNLDTSCPYNEFHMVPAYIRRDFASDGSESSQVEKFYSSISLLLDENGDKAHLSSLNSFLDGPKPD